MWEDDEYSVRQAVSDALIGMGAASVPAVDAGRRPPGRGGLRPVDTTDML